MNVSNVPRLAGDGLPPLLCLDDPADARVARDAVARLRLDPRSLLDDDPQTAAVRDILRDVARRGDYALVDAARRFDDPDFSADQIRVGPDAMADAAGRVDPALLDALRRAIHNVRDYQTRILPPPADASRPGLHLSLRHTPVDAAGCYFPGGKASYPSSLVHLVVPAQVAGVRTVVAVTPPSRHGKTDLVLAAGHLLGLPFMVRAGGAAAVAALAFGTDSVPRVDKIVGPGNRFVQIAKRLLAGAVGVDGFLGPSEVLVLADDSTNPAFAAADLLAQAEHDPGSCFLLATSREMAKKIRDEIGRQLATLTRADAARGALLADSALCYASSPQTRADFAAALAPEHVSVQTADPQADLDTLRHAGCVFLGPWSPVAVGDYAAGPSHCLPTNTTARFAGGTSVYEFLKRTGVVRYDRQALPPDADAAARLADAEGLDAHAASCRIRG